MIPAGDRPHIPDDLDDKDLAFWWAAFRTGREAEAAQRLGPMPAKRDRPAPTNGKIGPDEALRRANAAALPGDGYAPIEEGESTWISEMIDTARRTLAPHHPIEAVESALRAHPEVAKWIANDSPPSGRAMQMLVAKALEKARLVAPTADRMEE